MKHFQGLRQQLVKSILRNLEGKGSKKADCRRLEFFQRHKTTEIYSRAVMAGPLLLLGIEFQSSQRWAAAVKVGIIRSGERAHVIQTPRDLLSSTHCDSKGILQKCSVRMLKNRFQRSVSDLCTTEIEELQHTLHGKEI